MISQVPCLPQRPFPAWDGFQIGSNLEETLSFIGEGKGPLPSMGCRDKAQQLKTRHWHCVFVLLCVCDGFLVCTYSIFMCITMPRDE